VLAVAPPLATLFRRNLIARCPPRKSACRPGLGRPELELGWPFSSSWHRQPLRRLQFQKRPGFKFKLIGGTGLMLLFVLAQAGFLARHVRKPRTRRNPERRQRPDENAPAPRGAAPARLELIDESAQHAATPARRPAATRTATDDRFSRVAASRRSRAIDDLPGAGRTDAAPDPRTFHQRPRRLMKLTHNYALILKGTNEKNRFCSSRCACRRSHFANCRQGPAKPGLRRPSPRRGARTGPLAKVNGVEIPRQRLDRCAPAGLARRRRPAESCARRCASLDQQRAAGAGSQPHGTAKKPEVQQPDRPHAAGSDRHAMVGDTCAPTRCPRRDPEGIRPRALPDPATRNTAARHILGATEDDAKRVAELKKGGKFDDIAQKRSLGRGTRPKGRRSGLGTCRPTSTKAFADAMVKLDKGKMADAPGAAASVST